MTDLIWGWSTGGHKSHAWLRQCADWGTTYWALCDIDKFGWKRMSLWTTEKTHGDERTRCRKCLKLAAKE